MGSYLMMLYVTLEQESALKSFFVEQNWPFCKPDLSVITDKVGPVTPRLSSDTDSHIEAEDHVTTEEVPVNETPTDIHKRQPCVIKIPLPISKASTVKQSKKRKGKRKTRSPRQPTKPQKQAKLAEYESAVGDVTDTREKQNSEGESQESSGKIITPVLVQMENGETIQIKIEQDGAEREKVVANTDEADADDDFDDVAEADDPDYEEENDGDESLEDTMEKEGDVSQVELPDDGLTPKPERKKRGQGYRQYDLEKLRDAYNYVMETGSSVKGAAREFDVPETTLRDRVLNRISVDSTTYGRATVLNEEEETKLINHLKDMADIGYGFTQQEIVRKASDYAVELGKRELTQAFTYRWYRGFAKRHPPEPNHDAPFTVSKKALLCRNGKCITSYYNQLNGLVKKSKVDDKPGNIYLIEEVDIEVPTDEKFQTVTFIGAGNAAGQKIPPYFIVASGLTEEYHNLMRKSQLVTEGMKVYLQCHFLKYITKANESDNIIVLYDAHRICLSLQLIDWAKSMNILLFPLPPQTTYFVKACGEGLFQTIKKKYNAEYGEVSPYKHLTSTSGVVSILKTLYGSEVTSSALEEFFSKCGVCPLQESEIMCDFLKKQGLLT